MARPKLSRPPVRNGHLRALEELENTAAYLRTRELYRDALGGTEVYLRPTDEGFTVLSLDALRCESMVGVGSRGGREHVVCSLPPCERQVLSAAKGYIDKRDSLRRKSKEERHALELIGGALADGLQLSPRSIYFVAQEWRLPSGDKIDILGLDRDARALVVVELKSNEGSARHDDAKKSGDAWEQAQRYAAEIFAHRATLYPFFERLARALATAHGGPDELALDLDRAPLAAVSWPGAVPLFARNR